MHAAAQVWHNYGFDRHVMANMSIECQGFRGDTLHMARLADASRSGKKNYSLESLTSDTQVRACTRGRALLCASPWSGKC